MKKVMIMTMVVLSLGLVVSCGGDAAKKPAPEKKETIKKSPSAKKNVKTGKKSTYTWPRFWKSAARKMKLTSKQVSELKTAKNKYDAGLKALGSKKSDAAVAKVRSTYYASVKKAIGDAKGQQFINYMRRYKRSMKNEK